MEPNEESPFNSFPKVAPHGANSYRAVLKNCGKGGVELAVYLPDTKLFSSDKLPPALLPRKDLTEQEQIERNEANAKRAARRARQGLRLILKSMEAKYLWTFTFRENITDIDRVQRIYKRFHELFRKRYETAKFATIPEQQERGAWHLHVAVADRLDIHWVLRCWYMALGHKVRIEYDDRGKPRVIAYVKDGDDLREARSDEIMGSVNVRDSKRKWGSKSAHWDSDRLASYMAKYMEKTFSEAMGGRRRYWPSKDCPRPRIEKFWLIATNVDEALREAFAIVKITCCAASTQIFLSKDYMNIWIAGNGYEPPF
jgi:hypothetical protein